VQVEGGDTLDAGVLLLPMVKIVAPTDPRFVSTLRAVVERLVSDTLVFRYERGTTDNGIGGEEGTFSQTFTHRALTSAAINLDRALG
jgi:GH15 family glucan-1,4-alpha-glucosidase